MRFEVYDLETQDVVTNEVIRCMAESAGLDFMGLQGFSLNEKGQIVLRDKTGKEMYCDDNRFIARRIGDAYPDLDFFEKLMYSNIIEKNPSFEDNIVGFNIDVNMFPQDWPNKTNAEGKTDISLTRLYTTVMTATVTLNKDTKPYVCYGVFFGNEPTYFVYDPQDTFFEDLHNCKMKSRDDAICAY